MNHYPGPHHPYGYPYPPVRSTERPERPPLFVTMVLMVGLAVGLGGWVGTTWSTGTLAVPSVVQGIYPLDSDAHRAATQSGLDQETTGIRCRSKPAPDRVRACPR